LGFHPRQMQRIFPPVSVSRPASRPTQRPVQRIPGCTFLGVKHGWGVMLTTHPHLVPRSGMSKSYTPLPLASAWQQRDIFTFTVSSIQRSAEGRYKCKRHRTWINVLLLPPHSSLSLSFFAKAKYDSLNSQLNSTEFSFRFCLSLYYRGRKLV
jgi:hypothetical protein